jgi:hypothetical protein
MNIPMQQRGRSNFWSQYPEVVCWKKFWIGYLIEVEMKIVGIIL